jgi:hypothetical protein
MKNLVPIITALTLVGSPASCAGIDSRLYSCQGLQSLIAGQGFVFISEATFGDTAVASAYYCGGGDRLRPRSVATVDNPACPVNYCEAYTSGKDN